MYLLNHALSVVHILISIYTYIYLYIIVCISRSLKSISDPKPCNYKFV